MEVMDAIVNNKEVDTKFMMYSAHDWTVATMQEFMKSVNGNFTVVPYAAQYTFELHSTNDCSSSDCYWLEIYNNGVIQEFSTDACANSTKCKYEEFLQNLLPSKGFIASTDDYVTDCATPYTPADFSVTWIERKMKG